MPIFVFVFSLFFSDESQIRPYEVVLPENVAQGKAIFEKKCQRCHALKNIDNYTLQQWEVILPKMSKKAMMGKKKRNKVNAYIQWKLTN